MIAAEQPERNHSVQPSSDELSLGDRRYVTLVLRLVVDGIGHLKHGEVVDVEGHSRGRFASWRGLARVLAAELAAQQTPRRAAPGEI